jgi:hypothetical protein
MMTMQPSEPAYPAFDNAKPTDAERIAELEARVAALEARPSIADALYFQALNAMDKAKENRLQIKDGGKRETMAPEMD